MRDMNDLKSAFGEADSGFKDNVYRTLAALQKCEERKPMRKTSIRLIAAVALLAILSSGSALAMTNTWGILDFLNGRRIDVEVLPDVNEIIQTDLPQEGGKSELGTFSVREAVYDGQKVYITIEARPANPDYLLLGSDAMPDDPIGNMGPLFEDKAGTIAEYADANGQKLIHSTIYDSGAENGMPVIDSLDFVLEQDGTLVYMLNGSYADGGSHLTLELICVTAPFVDGSIRMEDIKRDTLTVTLQNTGTKSIVTNVDIAEYTDCGVRVDKITLAGSSMAIYTEIEFTVIDQEKFAKTDGGLWFEFIDESGDRLPGGADSSGSVEALDENGTCYIQKDSLRASEALPSEITLRGYNCWEKNRYETHTFEMN